MRSRSPNRAPTEGSPSRAQAAHSRPLIGLVVVLGVASGLQQLLLGAVARSSGALRSAMLSASVSMAVLAVIIMAGASRASRGRRSGELALGAVLGAAACGHIAASGLGLAWYLYAPGLLGLMLVGGLAYAVPKLGAGTAISLVVAGQMAVSLLLDQLGLLGLARLPLSFLRVLGAAVLLGGVLLILRPGRVRPSKPH